MTARYGLLIGFTYAPAPWPDYLSAAGFGYAADWLSGSANADFYSGAYSGPDRYAYIGTYCHAAAHSDPGTYPYAAADGYSNPDAYCYAATDAHADSYPYSDSDANPHADSYSYSYPYAHARADSDSNSGADTHAAADAHPNSNAYCHAAADAYPHSGTSGSRMDYLPRPRRLQHRSPGRLGNGA